MRQCHIHANPRVGIVGIIIFTQPLDEVGVNQNVTRIIVDDGYRTAGNERVIACI